jgi:hypothetical protein
VSRSSTEAKPRVNVPISFVTNLSPIFERAYTLQAIVAHDKELLRMEQPLPLHRG